MSSTIKACCLLLAVTASTVGLASAGNAAASCTDDYGCVWRDADFETGGYQARWHRVHYYDADFANNDYASTSSSADNSASSIHNNDNSSSLFVFQLKSCDGYSFSKKPNTTDANFANGTPEYSDGSSANNRSSAMAFANYLGSC